MRALICGLSAALGLLGGVAHAQGSGAAALAALNRACPGLARNADSLAIGAPVLQPATSSDLVNAGWQRVWYVPVRVHDTPSPKVAGEFKATGHSCHFEVEASKLQSVSVSKRACLSVCKNQAHQSTVSNVILGVDGSVRISR